MSSAVHGSLLTSDGLQYYYIVNLLRDIYITLRGRGRGKEIGGGRQ